MIQEKKEEDMPSLQSQIKQYKKIVKSYRENDITEKYLELETKYEAMKKQEVDLRHQIYQLNENNEKQKDFDMENLLIKMSIETKLLKNSFEKQENTTMKLEKYLNESEGRLKSTESKLSEDILKYEQLQLQFDQRLNEIRNKFANIERLLEYTLESKLINSHQKYNNNLVFVLNEKDSIFSRILQVHGEELARKMSEDKGKTEHLVANEVVEQLSVDQNDINDTEPEEINSQAKEIAELKKQVQEMKEMLTKEDKKDNEKPPKRKSFLDFSEQKKQEQPPIDRLKKITFREIQSARNVSQVLSNKINTSSMKNINRYLQHHKLLTPQKHINSQVKNTPLDIQKAQMPVSSKEKEEDISLSDITSSKNKTVKSPTSAPQKEVTDESIPIPIEDNEVNPVEGTIKKEIPKRPVSKISQIDNQLSSPKNEIRSTESRHDDNQNHKKEKKSFFQSIWEKLK